VTQDLRLPSQPQSTVTTPWPVLMSPLAEGRKPSVPEWLVTYQKVHRAIGHLSLYTNQARRH